MGFGFNYEVFAPNQSSIYPRNGGGGMAPFSGPVNSGDTIYLELSFYGDQVVMFAGDYNTGSYAVEFFSAEGANYFQGSTNGPANSNGFFTGLMTEWYHPFPFYGDMSKVTYSNFDFAQSYAWMWMDEFDVTNPNWDGTWIATPLTPYDYTMNPNQIQTLSFEGATISSNAYQFSTGSIVPMITSFTLIPSDPSNAVSLTDGFSVWYTLNGQQMSTFAKNGTTTIKVDSGTNVVIAGVSNSSTINEVWVSNSLRSNVTLRAGSNFTLYYYDLISQQVSYVVSGGGSPSGVAVTYYSAPNVASEKISLNRIDLPLMSSSPQTIMVSKGSTISLPSTISGTTNEQWVLQGNSTWTASTVNQIPAPVTYSRQFLLSFTGSQQNWQWVNSGTTTQVSVPGISDRTLGTGKRMASYSIDGNSPTIVQPTLGTTSISVYMNGPHTVSINWINQYQVNLDSSINSNLAYATAPTISNDNYWYDQGTTVNFVLNSIMNRASGSGNRLATFTVNGLATDVSTPSPVSVINLNGISSPQTISGKILKQFQFNSNSVPLVAVTNSSLIRDDGWYDSDTLVTSVYDYSWNQTSQSRTNAVGYAVNQGTTIPVERSGNGTFSVQVTMTAQKNVSISSTNQFPLFVLGGFNVTSTDSSPTKDTFYDVGTNLTLTTNTIGPLVNGNTRQTITGYTIDGVPKNTAKPVSIDFTTPTIIITGLHQLTFNSIPQYLVSFNLFDHNGIHRIAPSSIQIQTDQSTVLDVPSFGIWLNAGTNFQITEVIWENTNVKPDFPIEYTVNGPLNETLLCRIYDANIVVQDYLGLPIAGAKVSCDLANGTKLQANSDTDGTANFQMIPLGTFQATAHNLGVSASANGDATTQTTKIQILLSYPIFALIIIVLFVFVLAVFFRHKRAQKSKSEVVQQQIA